MKVIMVSFRESQKGNVAITVALLGMVLVILAGGAIDVGRTLYARSAVQGAVDSGVLAAGRKPLTPTWTQAQKEAVLKAEAQKLIDANLNLSTSLVTVQPVTATYIPPTELSVDKVQLSMSGSVPTVFLKLLGINKIDFTIGSQAERPQPGPIDLALVLDTTLSMASVPSAGGATKLATLKAAATQLVNMLMATGSPNIKVGIVPYSNYVNVGRLSPVPDWVLPIDMVITGCTRWTWEYPERRCPEYFYDCVVDGFMKKNGCKKYWWQNCPELGRQICQSSSTQSYGWSGCVGPRSVLTNNPTNTNLNTFTDASLASIANPTSPKYSGQSTWAAPSCGTQILPLTSNKVNVLSRISALVASGDTHIPSGLVWGWNLLAPGEPYSARTAAELESIGGKKVLLLMTDGVNTLAPRLPDGRLGPFSWGAYLPRGWSDPAKTNQLTSDLCANIKNDGILIFTVSFDVPAGSGIDSILRNCASDPVTMAFNADNNDQLMQAFTEIGNRLKVLKIVR